MDSKIITELSRMKEIMGIINEQVVTDYDSKYDYKKEDGKYYTKKKTSDSWIEAKGSSLEAIKTKVFKDSSSSTETPSIKDYGYSKNDYNTTEIPFKNREEGDKFRVWVNDNYPSYAKKIDLDRSGSFNNNFIKTAWKQYGKEYEKKYLNNSLNKTEDSSIYKWLRRTFPFLFQLIDSKNLTNSDFTEDHMDVIRDVVKKVKDRTSNFQFNKTYTTNYKDYNNTVASILDRKGQNIWDLIKLYMSGPDIFDVATTLGRFSFKVDENGTINVYDEYDFTGQYDITREDLDWENTNTISKIMKIMELGDGEIGVYGAIRHLAHLNNPQGGTNQGLTINLTIPDNSLRA